MGKVIGIAICDKKGAEMVVNVSAKVSFNKGIGDDYRGTNIESTNHQVSIITLESWADVCKELNSKIHWTTRKANVIIEGIDLVDSIGDILKIGEFYLEITEKMKTGSGMDKQFKGLKDALKPNWRSGVYAKVIKEGFITENDKVTLMIRE